MTTPPHADAVTLDALTAAVRHNCGIVDARHGADQGICAYLLKMRELYRWEADLPLDAVLPKADVGDWLSAREAVWADLEDENFLPVAVDGEHFDPFDTAAINARLLDQRLVYGAGLIDGGRPHFLLAELEAVEAVPDGPTVYTLGREHARGLNAPPAMALADVVYLRRDALHRFLWEKLETWRWQRLDNAMGRALQAYGVVDQAPAALAAMVTQQLALVRAHELGESWAARRLGEDWNTLLLALPRTPAELVLRAVRDLLADCHATVPALLAADSEAAWHFYAGSLSGMRRQLFPAFVEAYERWRETADTAPLQALAQRGEAHWLAVAEEALACAAARPEEAGALIGDFADTRRL